MPNLFCLTYILLLFTSINFINGQKTINAVNFYSADYQNEVISEANYETQKNKIFDYLNIADTWDKYRGDNIKVAVIDSGINYDHEDFMVENSSTVCGKSRYFSYSNKWYYYQANTHGYNYIDDTYGHGTSVAATIAAAVNNVGGLGIAPNVDLYVYKVTNSSNGYEWGAIQLALEDCIKNEVDVINMSFQAYEESVSYNGSTLQASLGCSSILSNYIDKCYKAGIVMVAAAGNFNTSLPSYPASNSHVISVGSFSENNKNIKADFSNYGSNIDLVAPGYVYVASNDSDYSYMSTCGTSFSAPLVAGAIALYKQKNPNATPLEIENALYASCDKIDTSNDEYLNWAGHGALNIANFLSKSNGAIKLDKESIELPVGETSTITISEEYEDGSKRALTTEEYLSESGDENICTISDNVITAINEGNTTVTIYAGDELFEIPVTVTSQINSEYWSKSFLNNIVCDNGVNPPSTNMWQTMKQLYENIDDKNILKNAIGNEYGSTIEKAILRYDYIINKYNINEIKYEDYINRNVKNAPNIIKVKQSEEIIIIFTIISSSMLAIFTLSILINKKTKH